MGASGGSIPFCNRTRWTEPLSNAVRQITLLPTRYTAALASLAMTTLLFSLCGCDPAVNEVRVEPGAAREPVFVLTDTTGRGPSGAIYGLSVVRCGADSAVWQIVASGSNGAPMRLTYGQAPPGYVTTSGPQPLVAGCYDVFITDGRRSRFRVDASGRVTADTRRGAPTR